MLLSWRSQNSKLVSGSSLAHQNNCIEWWTLHWGDRKERVRGRRFLGHPASIHESVAVKNSSPQLIPLVKSFLKHPTFCLTIGGCNYSLKCIEAGVPHGSVLGPTFYLFTHEHDIVNNHTVDLKITIVICKTKLCVHLETLNLTTCDSHAGSLDCPVTSWSVNK